MISSGSVQTLDDAKAELAKNWRNVAAMALTRHAAALSRYRPHSDLGGVMVPLRCVLSEFHVGSRPSIVVPELMNARLSVIRTERSLQALAFSNLSRFLTSPDVSWFSQ